MLKAKVGNDHHSALIRQSSHFVTEANQVGQAQFTFDKPVMATQNYLVL